MKLEHLAISSCLLLFFCVACQPLPRGPSSGYQHQRALCGDGERQLGEACDGQDLGGRTCLGLGFGDGALGCKPSCEDFDRRGCGAPESCGSGEVEQPELCDGANLNGETCETLGLGSGSLSCHLNCGDFDTSQCGPPPGCGDGERDGVEVCDDQDFGGLSCQELGFTGGGELECALDCLSVDASACVQGCQPTTCASEGKDCGEIPDKCGDFLSCGSCVGPETCGGGGVANVCGQGSCTPTSCAAEGRECGTLADGCGHALDCGSCQEGSCDASGRCVVTCEPDCSQQECGLDPRCGVECGPCSGGDTCVGGQCQPPGAHCDGYDAAGRLGACSGAADCAGSLECVGGGFITSAFCADATPCGSEPTARCCGAGEFCGQSAFSMTSDTFCCRPGEALGGEGLYTDLCSDAGLDIGCQSDADCPGYWGRGICATWRSTPICVECREHADCSGSTPACDPASNRCVACTQDLHCTAGGARACDPATHTCVQCTADHHCSGNLPHCEAQVCYQCLESAHCLDPDRPFCVGRGCDACRDDDDCGGDRPYCNSGVCEECPYDFLFGSSCEDTQSGRRACYPNYWPMTTDECASDQDCVEGAICDAPAGEHRLCIFTCP